MSDTDIAMRLRKAGIDGEVVEEAHGKVVVYAGTTDRGHRMVVYCRRCLQKISAGTRKGWAQAITLALSLARKCWCSGIPLPARHTRASYSMSGAVRPHLCPNLGIGGR